MYCALNRCSLVTEGCPQICELSRVPPRGTFISAELGISVTCIFWIQPFMYLLRTLTSLGCSVESYCDVSLACWPCSEPHVPHVCTMQHQKNCKKRGLDMVNPLHEVVQSPKAQQVSQLGDCPHPSPPPPLQPHPIASLRMLWHSLTAVQCLVEKLT